MCVAQPALWDQIVTNFVNHTLSEGVGNHSLGVSACEDDMDGGYCTCSKCRSWDVAAAANSSTGRLSDRYAKFWNRVYERLAAAGHPDKWVTGYAYASYTDPPLATKLQGNILILSVGFGSYPMLDNETAQQRQGWGGWHDAGAKAMALRPNSLWDGYSSAPYVIGQQLTNDLVFTAQHGLAATDFDSNVGHYQAVRAPLYGIEARSVCMHSLQCTLALPFIICTYVNRSRWVRHTTSLHGLCGTQPAQTSARCSRSSASTQGHVCCVYQR